MQRFFKLVSFFIFSISAAALLCACKPKNENKPVPPQQKHELTIGFSIDSFVIERWRRDCDVFMATAKENGASVIVQDAGNDVNEQIKQIQYLIDSKVDVLVIVPKSADSLAEVVQNAVDAGIPVISYDRLMVNTPVDLYITINSRKSGELMAQGLLEHKNYGKWCCILGAPEDYNMHMMSEGIHNVLSKSSVSIYSEFFTEEWNYDLSYRKMNELLESGFVPDGVLCGNDAVAETVLRSLSEHRIGNVLVSGQDADIAACQRVIAGVQTLTVYKPITQLAQKAAECAVELAKGKKPADLPAINEEIDNGFGQIPVLWLDPQLVTAQNIDDVIIKTGFHTEEEIYRYAR